MKLYLILAVTSCVAWNAHAYPSGYYYPYYGSNIDTFSYGANDNTQQAMALSRYYQPHYPRGVGGGMAAFMFGQPQESVKPQREDYYLPDRRRQTPDLQYLPPQQNEVYPQVPEKIPLTPTEQNIVDPTERFDIPTTMKNLIPELVESEVEEVEEPTPKPKKRVSKKKQVKRPVEDDDDEGYAERMPMGAFFPMYFGYGGRSGGGGPGGSTAIANAYSTGRGGVASSHATAYGAPRPEESRA